MAHGFWKRPLPFEAQWSGAAACVVWCGGGGLAGLRLFGTVANLGSGWSRDCPGGC